jgi:adenosylcobinamide kinase / adenosylcobinamide-phosphate guanylyltransferase
VEVVLLGTGSADGWPNPFCDCASCSACRAIGVSRSQTAALVDRRLLVDCGPEAPRAAARLGLSLAEVRHVLLTHAHPDHWAPASPLWRSWAGRTEPLDVFGPPAALAGWAEWLGPAEPVRFRPIAAGERLEVEGGYIVRVLAAAHDPAVGPPVLYDLTSPDGSRLLYATDTGPLPDPTLDATTAAGYDLVLLEETYGSADGRPAGHLDLRTFPAQLAELRRRRAAVEQTRVLAVHLGHRNPPPDRLREILHGWGADLPADGDVLLTCASPPPRLRTPRRVLLLGGARSGKSAEAERRLAAEPAVTYIATARPRARDPEWESRLAAHRERRPAGWQTAETTDVARLLRAAEGPLLVDDIGLWLTAVLDDVGWVPDHPALRERLDELVEAWRSAPVVVVAVSNEVGAGVVPATAAGRVFRDELGRLNARLAEAADEVCLLVAGLPMPVKRSQAVVG